MSVKAVAASPSKGSVAPDDTTALFDTVKVSLDPTQGAKQFDSVSAIIRNWLPRIHWLHTFILSFVPIISIIGLCTVPYYFKTFIFCIVYYFFTGLGITAGYHRLFAHKAYKAGFLTRCMLMLAGSGALEGSIKWWCGGHRVHHRYTDTPKDPYNAGGGFWYAHVGWMLIKPDPKNHVHADIRDLNADPIVRFQHKYYLFIGPFMAFVLPTLIAGLGWGDWLGGYFFAGALRLFFVHHSTFCVNSVAHYFGEHTFDDDRSPRDSIVTAVLTLGEGYHNFHHEFPNDYRNGIRWYHYDPTKWFIIILNKLGGAFNLNTFSKNEITRGIVYMREKKLAALKAKVTYPPLPASLPLMTWSEYVDRKQKGEDLILVDGLVHDVHDFIPLHPGGGIIRTHLGLDATLTFQGKTNPLIYKHSHAAENLLSNMRIARMDMDTVPQKKQQ